jgi:hypothetical protein
MILCLMDTCSIPLTALLSQEQQPMLLGNDEMSV